MYREHLQLWIYRTKEFSQPGRLYHTTTTFPHLHLSPWTKHYHYHWRLLQSPERNLNATGRNTSEEETIYTPGLICCFPAAKGQVTRWSEVQSLLVAAPSDLGCHPPLISRCNQRGSPNAAGVGKKKKEGKEKRRSGMFTCLHGLHPRSDGHSAYSCLH